MDGEPLRKKVAILLANGFEELEAAAFTDVLGWSRTDGTVHVDADVIAIRPELQGTWNLTVSPQRVIESADEVQKYDALAIPGGFEHAGYYEDAYHPLFSEIIRRFDQQKKPIASVCVGALPIGKSGVLKDRSGTTYSTNNSPRITQLAEMGITISKRMICRDDNIITSCGPATALDVAFLLLELLTDIENRETVQRAMGFDPTHFQERIG